MSDRRLLTVDDEADFGRFLRRVGERMGFTVETTTKADDFKRIYEDFDPTVICLDVMMPDQDGIELIQWLARRHCSARVIIISASLQFATIASELGVALGQLTVSKLSKPVSVADLERVLTGEGV